MPDKDPKIVVGPSGNPKTPQSGKIVRRPLYQALIKMSFTNHLRGKYAPQPILGTTDNVNTTKFPTVPIKEAYRKQFIKVLTSRGMKVISKAQCYFSSDFDLWLVVQFWNLEAFRKAVRDARQKYNIDRLIDLDITIGRSSGFVKMTLFGIKTEGQVEFEDIDPKIETHELARGSFIKVKATTHEFSATMVEEEEEEEEEEEKETAGYIPDDNDQTSVISAVVIEDDEQGLEIEGVKIDGKSIADLGTRVVSKSVENGSAVFKIEVDESVEVGSKVIVFIAVDAQLSVGEAILITVT